MFIATWIIVVAAIIAFVLFMGWMITSHEFEELKKNSFIHCEVKSVKFKVEIKYFSSSTTAFVNSIALNQLELLLDTSHYLKEGTFDRNAFDKLAANMGFHHVIFTTWIPPV